MNNAVPAPPKRPAVLLVEDTPSLQMLYRMVLTKVGCPPVCAASGAEALSKFEKHRPGVVLLDLMLPDMDGMTLLHQMLTLAPRTRIVVITANASIDKAIEATRKGAHDFLVKPLGDQRLVSTVTNALNVFTAQNRTSTAPQGSLLDLSPYFRHAKSEPMQRLCSQIAAVARSMAPVFILGEQGSGKKTVARMVHAESPRAARPFVTVNCALHDPPSLEAELFGRAKHVGPEQGAIFGANGGTLLIENPQDMPLHLQTWLLSILQNGIDSRSDAPPPEPIDLRLVCSARTHPGDAVRTGTLSADLYYHMFVIPLQVPALRDRGDDIIPFARNLVTLISRQEGKRFTGISAAAAAHLAQLPWPGNLRELINVLRHAVVLHDGPELTQQMLPEGLVAAATDATRIPSDTSALTLEDAMAGLSMAEIEERAVRAAIARHDGSIPRAARELDIAPSTIYRKRDVWSKPAT